MTPRPLPRRHCHSAAVVELSRWLSISCLSRSFCFFSFEICSWQGAGPRSSFLTWSAKAWCFFLSSFKCADKLNGNLPRLCLCRFLRQKIPYASTLPSVKRCIHQSNGFGIVFSFYVGYWQVWVMLHAQIVNMNKMRDWSSVSNHIFTI